MRCGKLLVLAALTLVAIGCPADRHASKTINPNSILVPPPMRRAAPPAMATITDLRTPESVLYDPQQDVYFISNCNGSMEAVDNNGFISRVDAKTMKVNLAWIAGGRGVRLDAPKGMAIVGDTLWVNDITAVRKFDRRSGAPLGEVPLPGATFINDMATDGTSVYVSDTGVKLGPGITFYPTGTDAIWKITGDRAEKIAQGAGLAHPNGLDFIDGKLHVVTFGGRQLYTLDGGKKGETTDLPRGQLDGLTHTPGGLVLVSSWQGDGIYAARGGAKFEPVLTGIDSPADISYDATHHRLLIPHPGAGEVTIHPFG